MILYIYIYDIMYLKDCKLSGGMAMYVVGFGFIRSVIGSAWAEQDLAQ